MCDFVSDNSRNLVLLGITGYWWEKLQWLEITCANYWLTGKQLGILWLDQDESETQGLLSSSMTPSVTVRPLVQVPFTSFGDLIQDT